MNTEHTAHSGSQMNKFCSCSLSAGGSRKHLPAWEIMLEIKLEMKFHASVPGNIENKGHKFVPSWSRYSHTTSPGLLSYSIFAGASWNTPSVVLTLLPHCRGSGMDSNLVLPVKPPCCCSPSLPLQLEAQKTMIKDWVKNNLLVKTRWENEQ